MLKRYTLSLFVFALSINALAQGSETYPLTNNPNIRTYLGAHPGYVWGRGNLDVRAKWQIKDTLDLPFFDDFFTTTEIYPDSNRWVNNTVFINSSFAIKPPSLGVATFDALDAQGNPYGGLAPQTYGICDTLTSQPIRLDSFTEGLNRKAYAIGDSVYLSFFYQGQGRGDDLRTVDILELQFKSRDGVWDKVWSSEGISLSDFKQALVPVLDTFYLHNAFQFRFLNYANYKGSVSHWHVDYIEMDRARNMNDTVTRDVTISGLPTSLLRYNSAMPWNQFVANPAREAIDSHYFYIHNLHNATANMEYRHEAKTMGGASIVVNDFNANNENILSGQELRWGFKGYGFDTMTITDYPVFVERNYRIRNDLGNPNNSNTDNDQITVKQEFKNYIAYDDGTAELGYGINYGSLPDNAETKVAYKFHLNEPDTLWGVSIFFNQSVEDVSTQVFYLQVYKSIELGTGNDSMIYEEFAGSPAYTDSINGFHTYLFDTTYIFLPAGDFYIGWRQNQRYVINIGFDMNYVPDNNVPGSSSRNPNLVENVTGSWRNVNNAVQGAPMIRAVVELDKTLVSVPKVNKPVELDLTMYPNPATNSLNIDAENEVEYTIRDISGRTLLSGSTAGSIDISTLVNGMYIVEFKDNKNLAVCAKKLIVSK